VRPDAIIGTGRSDYPNQVNNVLCFPFMFRGALDVGATTINEAMKVAAVRAIAELAHAEQSEVVTAAYGTEDLAFGPEYLIPKPFDPRLILKVAPAVAKAAMDSGVATRPIEDMERYRDKLNDFVYHTGLLMRRCLPRRRRRRRASSSAKARTSACCAPHRPWSTRAGEAHPDRPARGGRAAHHALRPAHPCRRAFRTGQSGFRSALQGAVAGLLRADLPQGRRHRVRQARDAPPHHPDRRHAAAPQPRRRHAVRHLRQAFAAPALHRGRDRPQARGSSTSTP
jgi:hypothetical protein